MNMMSLRMSRRGARRSAGGGAFANPAAFWQMWMMACHEIIFVMLNCSIGVWSTAGGMSVEYCIVNEALGVEYNSVEYCRCGILVRKQCRRPIVPNICNLFLVPGLIPGFLRLRIELGLTLG
jgi:hypothetical protein